MRTFATRGERRSWPDHAFGRFLACLAVYVQVLLPFVVVADLRITDASVGGFPICHVDSGSAPASSGSSQSTACCPLCLALGASAPFTAPAEPSLPLPPAAKGVAAESPVAVGIGYDGAVSYDARAPPLNS